LGAVGYTPNIKQSETVLFTLRTLYALVPSVCNVAGILVVLVYPIGDRLHEEIRKAIDQRRNGHAVIDPVTGRALDAGVDTAGATNGDPKSGTGHCSAGGLRTATHGIC
jgi:hypothetical protein